MSDDRHRGRRGPHQQGLRPVWLSLLTVTDCAVAAQTVQRCVERLKRLDEQGADAVCIGAYVRRWSTCVRSGLAKECCFQNVSRGGGNPKRCLMVPVNMGCKSPSMRSAFWVGEKK